MWCAYRREVLVTRKIADVMTRDVVVIEKSAPFKEILRRMEESDVSALPVVDAGGRLVGIVSESDLLVKESRADEAIIEERLFEGRRRRLERGKAEGLVARELMTSPAVTVGPDATLPQAAHLMRDHGVKRLPVTDMNGRVVGIVSRRDLLTVFLRSDAEIAREVRRRIAGIEGLEPDAVRVGVREGVAILEGVVEQHSRVPALVGLIRGIEGVVGVESRLSYEVDDLSHEVIPAFSWMSGAGSEDA